MTIYVIHICPFMSCDGSARRALLIVVRGSVWAGTADPWEKVEWGRALQGPTVEEFIPVPGACSFATYCALKARMEALGVCDTLPGMPPHPKTPFCVASPCHDGQHARFNDESLGCCLRHCASKVSVNYRCNIKKATEQHYMAHARCSKG